MNDLKNTNNTRPKVAVSEFNLLVQPGKSKKLAAMGKKTEAPAPTATPTPKPWRTAQSLPGDLSPEAAAELIKAQELIDSRIAQIMGGLPKGKQNKLFAFKYGSVEKLKALDLPAAFTMLGIPQTSVKLRLIAALNYHGDTASAD